MDGEQAVRVEENNDNSEPQGNQQGKGGWGEPINVTVPAPFADIVRTFLQAKKAGNGGRGCGGRRHRGGKQHWRKYQKQGKGKRNQKCKKNDEEIQQAEEVDAEIKELRDEIRVADADREESGETDNENEMDWESIPRIILERAARAQRDNEVIPEWVTNILQTFRLDLNEAVTQLTGAAAELAEAVAGEEEKEEDNQEENKESEGDDMFGEDNDEDLPPWLKAGNKAERVKQSKARMKKFKENKKGKGPGGPRRGRGGPPPHVQKRGPRGKSNCAQAKRQSKPINKHLKKNIGPYELEMDVTLTEREIKVPKQKRDKNQRQSAKKNEQRQSAKKALRQSRKKEQRQSKKNKAEKVVEKEEEPVAEKEEEPVADVEEENADAQFDDLSQEELLQLFAAMKKEFKKKNQD